MKIMNVLLLVLVGGAHILAATTYCPVNEAEEKSPICHNSNRRYNFSADLETYKPAYDVVTTVWDSSVSRLILCVFGTQIYDDLSESQEKYQQYDSILVQVLNENAAYWDKASFNDSYNLTNFVYFSYFTNIESFVNTTTNSNYATFISSTERLSSNENGYFEEIFFISIDNAETIHTLNFNISNRDIRGVSNLAKEFVIDKRHGYWKSARDRMTGSAFNNYTLENRDKWKLDRIKYVSNQEELGNTRNPAGQRINYIPIPPNMNIIRSGQDISLATKEDQQVYLNKIEPVLIKGMKYLQENPIDTQCIELRWLNELKKNECGNNNNNNNNNNVDTGSCVTGDDGSDSSDGNDDIDMHTSGFGYFVNLNNLENWAEYHETHLNIFASAVGELKKGNLLSVYLWHEVFVVDNGYANYINCHNKTGFLPWYMNIN